MTKKMWKIGIIGAGMMGKKHAADFIGSKRCVVDAIADVNLEAAKAFAEKFSVPNVYSDYHQILNDKSIDAVVIVTPPNTHCKIFVDAAEAGKHTLIEKPLGISKVDLDKMTKTAAQHPKLVALNASCRHARLQPKYDFIKNLIDSGKIGDVYHVHHVAVSRQSRPGIEFNPGAHWFLNKKLAGGGPSFDWGVYDLSFHLGILGDRHELKHVSSMAKNGLDKIGQAIDCFDVEEHMSAFMTFNKGLTYAWERSTNAHNENPGMTRIYGTKGGLQFNFPSWESAEITMFDNDAKGKARKKVIKVPMKGHNDDNRPLINHFLDCLDKKAKPSMPLALAAKHVDIIMQVLKSAQ